MFLPRVSTRRGLLHSYVDTVAGTTRMIVLYYWAAIQAHIKQNTWANNSGPYLLRPEFKSQNSTETVLVVKTLFAVSISHFKACCSNAQTTCFSQAPGNFRSHIEFYSSNFLSHLYLLSIFNFLISILLVFRVVVIYIIMKFCISVYFCG